MTAVDAVEILEQCGQALPEMPRFEDGMVGMRELTRMLGAVFAEMDKR